MKTGVLPFPAFLDDPAFVARLEQMLAAPRVPSPIVRILKERRDDLVRLQCIRALARRS